MCKTHFGGGPGTFDVRWNTSYGAHNRVFYCPWVKLPLDGPTEYVLKFFSNARSRVIGISCHWFFVGDIVQLYKDERLAGLSYSDFYPHFPELIILWFVDHEHEKSENMDAVMELLTSQCLGQETEFYVVTIFYGNYK